MFVMSSLISSCKSSCSNLVNTDETTYHQTIWEKLILEPETRKELILVHVVKGGQRNEFYIVDLEEGKLLSSTHYIQSLITECSSGSLVRVGTEIYYIGIPISPSAEDLDPDILYGDIHFHEGVSCLELANLFFSNPLQKVEGYKWKEVPPMPHSRVMVRCASLGGRLYAVGGSMNLKNYYIGDSFHPLSGCWQNLDPIPHLSVVHGQPRVSSRVISDERNARLLVHFEYDDSLYSYYPDNHLWCCIATKFTYWSPVSALVDDVLYFYHFDNSGCLRAYDLSSSSWLNIVHSSDICWPMNVFGFQFDAMLHLGNCILCLATFTTIIGSNCCTELQFVKFQVKRTSPGEVTVTRGSSKSVILEGYCPVRGFISLQEQVQATQ